MFKYGAQAGLTPIQVLDMDLFSYLTYLDGHNLWVLDQHELAVMTGYWASYYTNAKRPKRPNVIIASMRKGHEPSKPKAAIDTEKFYQMVDFEERLKIEGKVGELDWQKIKSTSK